MVSNKKNIIFDFDGVLADTSLIKSDVFKKFFLKFSQSQKIIDYQIKNKGISRIKAPKSILVAFIYLILPNIYSRFANLCP